jgi:hypothetical protein
MTETLRESSDASKAGVAFTRANAGTGLGGRQPASHKRVSTDDIVTTGKV